MVSISIVAGELNRLTPDQILIVGAGPTGLILALSLARRAVPFRIIDRHSGPGQSSRAMAVQARTLEFYRQLGFAEEIVARGIKMETLHLRQAGREFARLTLGNLGEGLSPYPFILSFPQDVHERFLTQELQSLPAERRWRGAYRRLRVRLRLRWCLQHRTKGSQSQFYGRDVRSSVLPRGRQGRSAAKTACPGVSGSDNFFPLKTLDWQVHVYGELNETFRGKAEALGLPVVFFDWNGEAKGAGLKRNAFYLIRPDGYVALASSVQNALIVVEFCKCES